MLIREKLEMTEKRISNFPKSYLPEITGKIFLNTFSVFSPVTHILIAFCSRKQVGGTGSAEEGTSTLLSLSHQMQSNFLGGLCRAAMGEDSENQMRHPVFSLACEGLGCHRSIS